MGTEAIISISKLVKRYKDTSVNAVDSIDLDIFKSETFGLLGPNGAGKTSTISMLSGLIQPSSGSIIVNNKVLNGNNNELKKIIGVVPQDIALFEKLTAEENLRFFGRMYGMKSKILNEKIEYYLDKFSLSEKTKKQVYTYSGGMKRRLNLIAGILHSPQILFLDEPTVGIDVQSKNVIIDYLKELNSKGMTLIYTSHLMEEAEKFCSQIAIIDNGSIIAEGSPSELISHHKDTNNLEEIFLKLTGRTVRE